MTRAGLLIMGLVFCLTLGARAEAGELQDGIAKTGKFLAQGVVVVDKAFHWTWDTLHQYVVHPVAELVTLGVVELDTP